MTDAKTTSPEQPAMGDPNMAAAFGVKPAPTQVPPMLQYRGYGLHQPFNLRERMKLAHEYPMMGMLLGAFPHPHVGRLVGQAGFDFVFLDWEHTPLGVETMTELIKTIQYASEGKTAVIARVPTHEHHWFAWCLDAGASGVVAPHVQNVEQAQAILKACRFPTQGGGRSMPPNALMMGYNDFSPAGSKPESGALIETFHRAAIIMQIEDPIGAENADAIAALEGVDGLMLGPGDLSLELGAGIGGPYKDPQWMACMHKVVNAAKKQKKGAMMPGFATNHVKMVLEFGWNMTTVANDGFIMIQGLRGNLAEAAEITKSFRETQSANGEKA